jgi:chromosomal replication initiation ATPase DnaA
MTLATQIPLELKHKPSFDLADFVVSSSNEEAFYLVEREAIWPTHAAAIIGPSGCGKSHLGQAWAAQNQGVVFTPEMDVATLQASSYVLVEDVEKASYSEEQLFHLFNWTRENGGKLLFTAEKAPNLWDISLPDLVSRFATLTVGRISEPDDELLTVLLVKLFSDRQMQVDMTVIGYALPRIERSFSAAQSFVERLDQAALAGKTKVSRKLAKNCLVDQIQQKL